MSFHAGAPVHPCFFIHQARLSPIGVGSAALPCCLLSSVSSKQGARQTGQLGFTPNQLSVHWNFQKRVAANESPAPP